MSGRGKRHLLHPEDALLALGLIIAFAAFASATDVASAQLAALGGLGAGFALGLRVRRW